MRSVTQRTLAFLLLSRTNWEAAHGGSNYLLNIYSKLTPSAKSGCPDSAALCETTSSTATSRVLGEVGAVSVEGRPNLKARLAAGKAPHRLTAFYS
jgi:hypothetical protein